MFKHDIHLPNENLHLKDHLTLFLQHFLLRDLTYSSSLNFKSS